MAVTVFIRYQIDPFKRAMFEQYARRWLGIIPRCGGDLVGYWMPHEGTNNIASALISFENLAAYESYRAYVRGKVSGMLEADEKVAPEARMRAGDQARKYYLLAEACSREPLTLPALYAVGGVIASGKSTVAEALGVRVQAPVVEADRVRKFLCGVSPTTPLADAAFSGHYDADTTARTYAELLRRADTVLASKRSVVLDASFRDHAQRAAALELAERHGVPFTFIECAAPHAVCKERLATRALGPSVSDGRSEIFDRFLQSYEPVHELPSEMYLKLDTSQPIAESMARIEARLG